MHRLWHVVVLLSTLAGACGALVLALAPLLFDKPPPGLARARPYALALAAGAAALLAAEWLVVHERSI